MIHDILQMFREKIYMKYEIDRFKNSEVIRCFFKSEKSIKNIIEIIFYVLVTLIISFLLF